MSGPLILPYTSYRPAIGARAALDASAAVIGRARLGAGVALGPLAVVRADGERIDVGDGCRFLDRATVHISDGLLPSVVGSRVTVGRYAVVHACTIGDDCVLADGAVVMDGSTVGAGAVIAAGALVPPGKTLAGGVLYAGNPARPVRAVSPGEREALRRQVVEGRRDDPLLRCDLPALDMGRLRPAGAEGGPLFALAGAAPRIDSAAFVAPNAIVAGAVSVDADAGVWFATVCRAEGAEIRIGARTSVQDNSILVARAEAGAIVIGEDVTVGHNVRLGACTIGNGCLIGMGCEIADAVVVEDGAAVAARAHVEPGTVVDSGIIWAGRPARPFRALTADENEFFRRGKEVYVGYARAYLAQAAI
jgi:carbonic anhydrase/acetyltransferase-like protein (isoleucine patch superfamily)